jgi:hypothetical protein
MWDARTPVLSRDGRDASVPPGLWTRDRYSERVVARMASAAIITVAANLDIDAGADLHGYRRLEGP